MAVVRIAAWFRRRCNDQEGYDHPGRCKAGERPSLQQSSAVQKYTGPTRSDPDGPDAAEFTPANRQRR
jgi:hypothetical protein